MAGLPREYQERIAAHMEGIKILFKNPRLTLVVRNPDLTAQGLDGDCVITDDDLDEAVKAIQKRQAEINPPPQVVS